ncbi:Flp pilus assembly protein CpaB [Nocardioides sp. Arc9.136]|uniref:Flp pilus assembly protein CpaB n=1 Tax=Nocardioides sp. Arc9.136 TaxID=2996826 RepID=UPI0026664FEE|nr:Flp pilus assembly protein CpaB [Nocardioides sp. Arc9.136]WKN50031.1 Flp pilus assembly protein CpaB [Nocardioides sp. Arc9.136]
MDRRRILLIAAAVVAALGVVLVLLYVRGADARAQDRFVTVEVLRATAPIAKGEKIEDALAAGKVALQPVAQDQLLDGAQGDAGVFSGQLALVPIYPGEQLIPAKFGGAAQVSADTGLQLQKGQVTVTVNLTDTARVAGFVNPGSQVAVFFNGSDARSGQPFTRLLLPEATVLAVGSTTPVSTTTTDQTGQQTVEQLPRTLITLALSQAEAERVMFAQGNGELAFALVGDDTQVRPGPGVTTDNLFG